MQTLNKVALISASLPEFITEIHLPTRFSSRNVAYRSNPRKWFSNTIKKKFDYHSGYNEHCNIKFHSQNFNAYWTNSAAILSLRIPSLNIQLRVKIASSKALHNHRLKIFTKYLNMWVRVNQVDNPNTIFQENCIEFCRKFGMLNL